MTSPSVLFPRSRSFWYGMKLPLEAAKLILQKKTLLVWSIFPILLTLILYFYVIASAQEWAQGYLNELITGWGLDPTSWVGILFGIVTKLVLLLLAAFTFTFTSSIVASPFNDYLAEKSEPHATPPLPPVQNQDLRHHIRTIAIDLAKTVAAGIAGLTAFVFSLIPFVNMVTFAVMFLLVSFQYVSYPQTRRGIALKDSAIFLWRHLYACMGLGATISFLYAIPLVSSFALPVAVVAGTLLFSRAPGDEQRYRLK